MLAYFNSPMFKDQLYGWIRAGLAAGGGALIKDGYVPSGGISPELLSGLAMLLVTCALSALAHFTIRQKLGVAQLATSGITEQQIDSRIALGAAVPSVLTPADKTPVVVKLHG
jgi:hypothetical protein